MANSSAVLVLLVVTLLVATLLKETQAACGSSYDLAACLPAAESDIQPSAQCCTQLSSYLATDTPEECLCQTAYSPFFQSGADIQFAIKIPQKCNLSYRAGIQCNGNTIPGGQ
ncbi:uncharacterized protein [Physcomitrium patens]|uniref:Bifunctional inhibitor/plant lipid transfer protein/seed storage helical domain-containing protein n=1 Tax=Physcomitrium patens TaxID=3218 RepID=A0A2K1ISK1_PHYPA|nr:probable non-specific lipid-transfer protein AKCS9 [Physcomitrium patens]PNR32238.1 hypothetical protein PHYPA_026364 [Physcomitrium patens]|eukprot:XP_024359031.1 probable non-specific lipid-transfer protein AKCS9 [Physcomitrella patens]